MDFGPRYSVGPRRLKHALKLIVLAVHFVIIFNLIKQVLILQILILLECWRIRPLNHDVAVLVLIFVVFDDWEVEFHVIE